MKLKTEIEIDLKSYIDHEGEYESLIELEKYFREIVDEADRNHKQKTVMAYESLALGALSLRKLWLETQDHINSENLIKE